MLRVGEGAFLALPGEPFVSLGMAMRADSPYRHLLITALSNDFGGVSYIAPREDYEKINGADVTIKCGAR